MEKILTFMYRYWGEALVFSLILSAACIWIIESVLDGGYWRLAYILPFQITVTFYHVSMVFARRYYDRSDEPRYRAHYLRDTFSFLTVISWIIPFIILGFCIL